MLSWCDTSFRSISRKCYDEEKYSAVDLFLELEDVPSTSKSRSLISGSP